MNKENIPVITDKEELYDKCENMEELYDKYYLPLLEKHYKKTYILEQALDEIEKYMTNYIKVEDRNENVKIEFNELLKIIKKAKGDSK